MRHTICVIVLSFLVSTNAFSSYRLRIPSGLNVKGYGAVGHVNKYGGGQPTQFGIDFEKGGARWSKFLCEMDSDKDGATNGEELGDPCCEWRVGLPTKPNPTSPGHFNEFTLDELNALRCQATNSDSSSSESTSTSTKASESITNPSTKASESITNDGDEYVKEL
uniref:Secreted protein n=1 Tax=Thraustotheca clavata TaxID=74557 RepID=A0A0A7CLG6_9STRA|nr:secreted protein [Thraustotheca clavata]